MAWHPVLRPGRRTRGAVLVGAALFCMSVGDAEAQPAVLVAAGAPPATERLNPEPEDVRATHFVRLDAGALDAAVGAAARGTPAEIALEVAPGMQVRSREVWSERRPGGGVTWSGTVEGDGLGHVLLSREGRTVAGRVMTEGRVFGIGYAGAGRHVVYEVDPSQGTECEVLEASLDAVPAPPRPDRAGRGRGQPPGAQPDTITVMFLPTESTRVALGEGLEAFLQALVDTANDVFVNTEVRAWVKIAAVREVPDLETSSNHLALAQLTGTSDGVLDEVHAWRLQEGADLVTLVPTGGDACGVAYVPGQSGSPDKGFNLVRQDCAQVLAGNFPHEIGHNLGLRHDPYVVNVNDSPFYNGHGFVNLEADQPFRTIMAYSTLCEANDVVCPVVPYFSTTALTLDGAALGGFRSNAANVLYQTVPLIADYMGAPLDIEIPHAPDLQVTVLEDDEVVIERPEQIPGGGYVVFDQSVSRPSHGTVSVGATRMRYTPAEDFFGADAFAYRVYYMRWPAVGARGTVHVEVEPVPDPPLPSRMTFPSSTQVYEVLPDSGLLRVAWSELLDPDPDTLTARWELLPPGDSPQPLLGIDAGSERGLDVPMPVLYSVLVQQGMEPGDQRDFVHRVVVSDGMTEVAGSSRRLRLRRAEREGEGEEPEEPPAEPGVPEAPVLVSAYPNPASTTFSVRVGIPRADVVAITLYDTLGRRVRRWQAEVATSV